MSNACTAIFERDGDWYVAYCPEVPGANGQGRTKEKARASLARATALIFQDRREDALRSGRASRGHAASSGRIASNDPAAASSASESS